MDLGKIKPPYFSKLTTVLKPLEIKTVLEIFTGGKVDMWDKTITDKNNELIYMEDSEGVWSEFKYDDKKRIVYYNNTKGSWLKLKYDDDGNIIYREDYKYGITIDKR